MATTILFHPQHQHPVSWNTNTRAFTAEVSDLRFPSGTKEFILKNVSTGTEITFKFQKVDTDATGEDVYGWWFRPVKGHKFPCKFLLIND